MFVCEVRFDWRKCLHGVADCAEGSSLNPDARTYRQIAIWVSTPRRNNKQIVPSLLNGVVSELGHPQCTTIKFIYII